MDNKTILSSMAMDLKRAALGWQRNSNAVADRFLLEALKRKREADETQLPQYIKDLFVDIEKSAQFSDSNRKAEYVLMYSTLIQNFVLHKM